MTETEQKSLAGLERFSLGLVEMGDPLINKWPVLVGGLSLDAISRWAKVQNQTGLLLFIPFDELESVDADIISESKGS